MVHFWLVSSYDTLHSISCIFWIFCPALHLYNLSILNVVQQLQQSQTRPRLVAKLSYLAISYFMSGR